MSIGPKVPFSEELHRTKYREEGETFRESQSRLASALKDSDDHYIHTRDILLNQQFMAAGRVQASMGSTRQITPYNCFVSRSIQDSLINGHGSICNCFAEAMRTMQMGGGIGYDFSTLRPKGALIKKLGSQSSGPVSFMGIFDAGCRCIASAGHRRGAQMGVLRVDHPDIEEFIRAKQNQTHLTGFNISIAVTDEFMRCVETDTPFKLRFEGTVYKEVNARTLWETIMRSTWDWAEPGVLFIDRINETNNLWYCETIAATNPCAEQPLPPYGACLLGSFNLAKYVYGRQGEPDNEPWFDNHQFCKDIPVIVRAMDNVVDRAIYPLYEQEQEAKNKRRMGLGVTGLANALEALGHPYGSEGFVRAQGQILKNLANEAYRASAFLAEEKGCFPLFNRDKYMDGEFIQTLDHDVQQLIHHHGIRNSHLTSIAPTGTISMCADNVSSGIEPVFAHHQARLVHMPEGQVQTDFVDYGLRVFGVEGRTSAEVTVDEHMRVLETAYKYVDSAVSKTCNVPASTPWEDFKGIYMRAWKNGCKGCTTFQTGGKRTGIIEDKEACKYDPETGTKTCE